MDNSDINIAAAEQEPLIPNEQPAPTNEVDETLTSSNPRTQSPAQNVNRRHRRSITTIEFILLVIILFLSIFIIIFGGMFVLKVFFLNKNF